MSCGRDKDIILLYKNYKGDTKNLLKGILLELYLNPFSLSFLTFLDQVLSLIIALCLKVSN